MIMSAPFSRANGLRQTTVNSGLRSRRCYAITKSQLPVTALIRLEDYFRVARQPPTIGGDIQRERQPRTTELYEFGVSVIQSSNRYSRERPKSGGCHVQR